MSKQRSTAARFSLIRHLRRGPDISKKDFKQASQALRVDLINAQFDLKDERFAVIVLLAGNDLPGGNEVLDSLNQWLDARYLDVNIFERPAGEDLERPSAWRYWSALPPDGRIGIMSGAWAIDCIGDRALGDADESAFERRISHARRFEQMLVEDGTLLLKFWLHVSKDDLADRLRLAFDDPDHAWRLTDRDWQLYQRYDEMLPAAERYLGATHDKASPWMIVDSVDSRSRDLILFRKLRDAMTQRLRHEANTRSKGRTPVAAESPRRIAKGDALGRIDLSKSLTKGEYKQQLDGLQSKLHRLTNRARQAGRSAVLVFEGWDAAGKGGAIRRVTRAMEARNCRVIPIGAPTDEELARHYLWRFWRGLPRLGRMVIFDRSWYGRVLVERIEGFASRDEWTRAYDEINDFEQQLVEHGTIICKFWLQIDADEQLRRFTERAQTAFKKYKLTDEDYRNRDKWPLYEDAANDMIARTNTKLTPWTLVPAMDKRYARVQVLRTIVDAYEQVV